MPARSAFTADEQLRFLISCIKHASNGRVDFAAVAADCNAVTKAAAAKRYERLLKQHGVRPNEGPSGRDSGVEPLRPRQQKKKNKDAKQPAAKAEPQKDAGTIKLEDEDGDFEGDEDLLEES